MVTFFRKGICAPLFAVFLLGGHAAGAAELQPGDVLSQDNWQKAEGLLPPEVLRHYQKGEYANRIFLWEDGKMKWSKRFVEATAANGQRLDVDETGSIIDRESGKQPPYIYGFPFPHIDSQDPRAGIKILWNYFFMWWNNGNFRNYVKLNWIDRDGLERSAIQDVYFLYYLGQPREYIPSANPNNLYIQFLATTVSPADLHGITALTWRYRDADKRDSNWAYVPALRRVRQVSPANRSDGFLGSDLSQDDGPFFDGKPEDFTWTLVGERDTLRLVDPYSLQGEVERARLPDGGWRGLFADVPMIGFQDPRWSGVPWAPVNFGLAKRRCWIIEGVPKDRYYLYGKIQLYLDRQTYQGAFNRKFDWKGQLVNTYMVFAPLNGASEGDDYYWSGRMVYQGAENMKMNRATVVSVPEGKEPPNDRRIHLEPTFFDYQTLQRFGK